MSFKMMSSILEKTVEQTVSLIRGNSTMVTAQEVRLKNLHESIVGTNTTMRMQEYKQTVEKCIELVRQRSQELHLSLSEKRECLLIITHLCSFDHKLPSVHPFVIKFIEDSKTLLDKKLGYLALTTMSKTRESEVYLAVNTILKDISSKSSAVACIALTTLASVIDVDLIPVFLPTLQKLLKSGDSATRCKVLTVLHTMVRIGPEFLVSIWDILVRALCDIDPHVMSSSLPTIETLLEKVPPPEDLKLHKKVIFILRQVERGCLPIDMMHGGICGPWTQIRLLRIVRKMTQYNCTDLDIQSLREVFKNIFARFQPTSMLYVAIISESIYTILSFHPKLTDIEGLLDVLDKILSSSNPNVLHCGIEMVKALVTVKSGFSGRYSEILLNTLSDRNPSTLKLALELLDDFTNSEESDKIINTLIKKLKIVSNCEFRKEIFFSLLRILEKFPMKDKWILENYLSLLGLLKNDIDFALVKKLLKCMQSVPREFMQNEAIELAKSLKHKFTALQYCTVLEMLSFYHKDVPDGECQKAANDIVDNCRRIIWQSCHEEILALSWSTVVTLAAQHDVEVDLSKFEKSSSRNLSIMLLQQRGEMLHLLKQASGSKVMTNFDFSCLKKVKIDPNLPFLNEFTQKNDDQDVSSTEPQGTSNGTILCNEPPCKDIAFKTDPYTKSRFDMSEAPLHDEVKPKKRFLDNPKSTSSVPCSVWDSKNYVLDPESK